MENLSAGLSSTQLDSFARDGFVKGAQIINVARADDLRDEVLRVTGDHQNRVAAPKQAVGVGNLWINKAIIS